MIKGPPFDVVVLAAGRSSRMGQPKGLVHLEGRPWVLRQLDALARAGVRATIVLGEDRQAYQGVLSTEPTAPGLARVTFNDDPDRGPFSSLQCGLAAIAPGAPVYVLPIDVPAAAPDVWTALRDALSDLDAAVPTLEGRGGHPVLLAASIVVRLLARPSGSRLDHELAELGPGRVARVPITDPAVRLNLNAPQDWGKLDPGN